MGAVLYLCIFVYLSVIALVTGDTYSVKILTEQHVNLVDSRFLSFTIDPKYLFATSEKYSSKECICMASSLTPAYLRVAGPSTAHMSFQNTTISINDIDFDIGEDDLEIEVLDADIPQKVPIEMKTVNLAATHRKWRRFIHWAKSTGFDLVFALNNEERTAAGMWDPNTALNMLTVAEKAKVGDIFWELGYECKNQSIEEYLNDLETLRVIVDTFPPGRTKEWKVVGADITKCLQADSKSDFKDYIMLSNDMMDALLLNGNSSSQQLQRMSELNRLKLQRMLLQSSTPLWLTENNQRGYNQFERAADWLAGLGHAARHGFSVHYRELDEEEMYEPTLSFYMALLFKNLVGERVLDIEMELNPKATLFGHCTSLRQKPVAGVVTLFGVNMDEEPARFSLKLPKREEGGDVLQFILGYDHSGNIVVNGRAMYYEGDIKPVVKHVRPFRTLLITLPAKSFGFWVLGNTKMEACQDADDTNKTNTSEVSFEDVKVKRSVEDDLEDFSHIADLSQDIDLDTEKIDNNALRERITDINRDIFKINEMFQRNKNRFKREDGYSTFGKLKSRLQRFMPTIGRNSFDMDPRGVLNNILQKAKQSVHSFKNKGTRQVRRILNKNKVNKRHSRNFRANTLKKPMRYEKTSKKRSSMNDVPKRVTFIKEKNISHRKNEKIEQVLKKGPTVNDKPTKMSITEEKYSRKDSMENEITEDENEILKPNNRKRREAVIETEELLATNDLEPNEKDKSKLWKILKNIQEEMKDFTYEGYDEEYNDSQEGIVIKTELSDDTATLKVKESGKGLIQSTMNSMVSVLEDLNKNLNRLWGALSTIS